MPFCVCKLINETEIKKTQPCIVLFSRTYLPKQVSYSISFTDFTGLVCFQVVCLEIIRLDRQGVLHVSPIREFSTKLAEHFVFFSVKPQPFLFILPCLQELACFLVEAGI